MSQFIQLFPLSIFRDKIELEESYREELIDLILNMESETRNQPRPPNSAWLGDTSGHEFLFQQPAFALLFKQIAAKVKEYVVAMGLNAEAIDFHYQRAWATVSRQFERISEHSHEQSNISFAYYLQKPKDSGGICFITDDHPNEFSSGLFSPSKQNLGMISNPSMLTWNRVVMDLEENDIVIFPSKTHHATLPNKSDDVRISLSADITALLRESQGHETMMPHFSNWRSFDSY